MHNLLTVAFEAHHAERNHHRRYQITIGRDLFNDWVITIHYGRTGRRGQEQRFADADADKMRGIIRERLGRRLSAPRRIGCRYKLTELSSTAGFDADSWLPSDMLAGFLIQVGHVNRKPGHRHAMSTLSDNAENG
jgi:predicted DNA-binding WGR domain protein